MNDIPQRQNSENFLQLLRARSRLYAEAKRYQWAQFILTVIVAFALGIVGIFAEPVRPYGATAALVITVLDAVWLDRKFRAMLAEVARVCERFDCDLLGLAWKPLVAGQPVDHEDVARAARSWTNGDSKLMNWYPPVVGQAPLELARLVCQRTNLWYDSSLRRGYATWLVAGSWIALAVLLSAALYARLDLLNVVVAALVPAAPLLIWAIREGLRQRDAATANDHLKVEAERAINDCVDRRLSPAAALNRAREIQDGIFNRRVATTPVLISGIYHWRRKEMEQQMVEGAEKVIRCAGH